MYGGAGRGRIRVFYVERSPAQHAFTKLLGKENLNLDLTTSTQPEEILDILGDGFDCLVLAESKPYIDGEKIGDQEGKEEHLGYLRGEEGRFNSLSYRLSRL